MESVWISKRHLNSQKHLTVTKITFSQKAVDALIAQANYIFKLTADEEKADLYLDMMESYITQTLSQYPLIGRPAPEISEGIRKLVYKRYTILYRIHLEEIEILTIYKENLPLI